MRDRGRRAAAMALALLATACSIDPTLPAREPVAASRAAREGQLNAQWQGFTLRELVQAWGQPQLLLDIPGGGNPPGFVLVYPRDAVTGCLDTFAIAYGSTSRVRSYQCR